MKKNFSKLLALYLPYFLLGLAATNFGEAWRLAEGKEMGDKILSLMSTIPAAEPSSAGHSGGHLLRCRASACSLPEKQECKEIPAWHGVRFSPVGQCQGH